MDNTQKLSNYLEAEINKYMNSKGFLAQKAALLENAGWCGTTAHYRIQQLIEKQKQAILDLYYDEHSNELVLDNYSEE